jgi:hypothetical protein
MTTPYFQARIGERGRLFPVRTWRELSETYLAFHEEASRRFIVKVPPCLVVDEDGTVYAHVSITGRIWRGHPRDQGLRTECLYQPAKERAYA